MITRPRVGIVGAGINGLLIAKALRDRDFDVVVMEQGDIPNPRSASHGVHRLIHPWTPSQCAQTAKRVNRSLSGWYTILSNIDVDGFIECGVVVSNMNDKTAQRTSSLCPNAYTISPDDLPTMGAAYCGQGEHSLTIFRSYGYLLASQILEGLVRYLKRHGVVLNMRCCVQAIEEEGRTVRLSDGSHLRFDQTILCCGDGLTKINGVPKETLDAISPTKMRCYVAYLDPKHQAKPLFGPHAWTGISGLDLWGMPKGDGTTVKLGCGEITRSVVDQSSPEDDESLLRQSFIDYYGKVFAGSLADHHLDVRWNHWTQQAQSVIFDRDYQMVVAACNGVGFKLAPITACDVAKAVCKKFDVEHMETANAW